MATAAGTLVLAAATFKSIRSSQEATALTERALLAGQRPLIVPSRPSDPEEPIRFGDGYVLVVPGHGGRLALGEGEFEGHLYMGMAVRNGGMGIAIIHGWRIAPLDSHRLGSLAEVPAPDPADFRRQQRDFYIASGDTGFWQGAVRDSSDPDYAALRAAVNSTERIMVDLLYGDHEGGQRMISRFGLTARDGDEPRCEMLRLWAIDGIDPRSE